MEGEYENPTHILTLHIIEKLMSALCNLDYQVNHQNLMTALDDLIKVGIGGRRRKRKLKYASEEARFDFQGDVLNITHNGMTKGVEAKGKGIGRVFINWKCLAYFSTYEKNQEYLRVFVEDNLFHIETLSFPCTKTEIYSAVNDDRNYDRMMIGMLIFIKNLAGTGTGTPT